MIGPDRMPRLKKSISFEGRDLTAEIVTGIPPERLEWERELLAADFLLPLPHREAWSRIRPDFDSVFVLVREDDVPLLGFAAQANRTRSFPGHLILRVQRFGGIADAAALFAGMTTLADAVARHGRILRLHVEVLQRDEGIRRMIGQACLAGGFSASPRMRSYTNTVALDLSRDEEEIFRSLHRTARRHIRAVGKRPVEIRAITDGALQGRMNELSVETMERTGGRFEPRKWTPLLDTAARNPNEASVLGLFRTDIEGPEALLAFAVGYLHGDCGEQADSASTRDTDVRMPLMYGLVWELIRWSKRGGASWFDFGGISSGTHEDDDPVGGIADFKRYFSADVITVGEEWVLEPRPLRAAVARVASVAAGRLRG